MDGPARVGVVFGGRGLCSRNETSRCCVQRGFRQNIQRSFGDLRTVPPEVTGSGTETCRANTSVRQSFETLVAGRTPAFSSIPITKTSMLGSNSSARALPSPSPSSFEEVKTSRAICLLARLHPQLPHACQSCTSPSLPPSPLSLPPPGGCGARALKGVSIPKATERSRTRPRLSMPVMGLTAIFERICRCVGLLVLLVAGWYGWLAHSSKLALEMRLLAKLA